MKAYTLRQKNGIPRKNEEVPKRELEKPRRNMLLVFGYAGLKIEAQKTRHPKKWRQPS